MRTFLHRLRHSALAPADRSPSDAELLELFLTRNEAGAFEALVRRHGAMVLGVCRRVLGNAEDAEDAFQATFLVLARKGATIRPPARVGSWLYGVARRTALQARAGIARRKLKERQVRQTARTETDPDAALRDLLPLLDEELSRLPEKYREAVVLCELEGRPRREVARHLGLPEGTLSSRLAKARKLLAARLAGRGLAVSAGTLAGLLVPDAAASGVPGSLVTAATAAGLAASLGTAGTRLSLNVAALAEGVMKTMFLAKLKQIGALLVLFGVLAGAGMASLGWQAESAGPGQPGAPASAPWEKSPAAPGGKGEKVRVKLVDVERPLQPADGLMQIAATLELDRTQPAGNGLEFVLRLANEGKEAVSCTNPLDSLQVLATDKDGWPVTLPAVAHRHLINVRDPEERAAIRLPFRFGPVTVNGRALTKEETERARLTLPPGGTAAIPVRVDRIVGKPGPPPGPGDGGAVAPGDPIPIPAGTYRLKVSVSPRLPDEVTRGRRLDSAFVEVHLTDLPAPARSPPAGPRRPVRPDAVPKEGEALISWGGPVNGLRAGLRFASPARVFKGGETVRFTFLVRNVSDRPVRFEYVKPVFHRGGTPIVAGLAAGQLTVPAYNLPSQPTSVDLAPGQTFELGQPYLVIQPPGWQGKDDATTLRVGPGSYKVRYAYDRGLQQTKEKPLLETGNLAVTVAAADGERAPKDARKDRAEPPSHAYWLLGADDASKAGYVPLLLTRGPVEKTADPLASLLLVTYRKDSVWNTDRRPIKPPQAITRVNPVAGTLEVNGSAYRFVEVSVEVVLHLLENPGGTLPVHRREAPLAGAEALAEALRDRLRQQTRDNVLEGLHRRASSVLHVEVLELKGGVTKEQGGRVGAALCKILKPCKRAMVGPEEKGQTIRFRFRQAAGGPLLLRKGRAYVVFRWGVDGERWAAGEVRFPTDARPEAAYLLSERNNAVLPARAGLLEKLRRLAGPPGGPDPAAPKMDAGAALKKAAVALEAVLVQAERDPRLKPRAGQTVRVETPETPEGAQAGLRYETADRWPDLPSKPAGPRPGNGSVEVRVIRGPARTGLDAPFLPPRDCHYALSVYGTSVPGVSVSVWSMTRDREAQGRLEALVRERLHAAGIVMNEQPVRPAVRGRVAEDGPGGPPLER